MPPTTPPPPHSPPYCTQIFRVVLFMYTHIIQRHANTSNVSESARYPKNKTGLVTERRVKWLRSASAAGMSRKPNVMPHCVFPQ